MEVLAPRSDLEERTERFARDVRAFVKQLPRTAASIEDGAQLIRSSGSVGANYIEAQEAMSRKDSARRAKISRKEARESKYWLNLLEIPPALTHEHKRLLQEVTELLKIFRSSVTSWSRRLCSWVRAGGISSRLSQYLLSLASLRDIFARLAESLRLIASCASM